MPVVWPAAGRARGSSRTYSWWKLVRGVAWGAFWTAGGALRRSVGQRPQLRLWPKKSGRSVPPSEAQAKKPLYGAQNRAFQRPDAFIRVPQCRAVRERPGAASAGGARSQTAELLPQRSPDCTGCGWPRARTARSWRYLTAHLTAVGPETPAARARTPSPPVRRPAGHKYGRAAAAARAARPPAIRRQTALRATACARGERGPDAPTHSAYRNRATVSPASPQRRSLTRQKQVVQSTKNTTTTRRTPPACRP